MKELERERERKKKNECQQTLTVSSVSATRETSLPQLTVDSSCPLRTSFLEPSAAPFPTLKHPAICL